MPSGFGTDPRIWLEDGAHAATLLDAYLNHEVFSGAIWDSAIERRLGPETRDLIDAEDLYGPTLLSAPIRRSAGHAIILNAGAITELLQQTDHTITLWHSDETHVRGAIEHASRLLKALDSVPYVGPTRASKLAAAKRPTLVPIWDTKVTEAIGADPAMSWTDYLSAWRVALDSSTRRHLTLLSTGAGHESLPALRTLDIVIWMDVWGWRSLPADAWAGLRQTCERRASERRS